MLDKEELKEYENEMSTEDDYREWHEHELELACQAARAEGEAKGRAEGREALLETARRMLAKGIGAGIVAECTGLMPQDIATL